MAAFRFRRRLLIVQRAFNSGMYAVTAYAAGKVYLALGGVPGVPDRNSFPAIIWPFVAAGLTHAVVNDILVNGVLRLTGPGTGSRARFAQRITTLVGPDLGYGMVGLLHAPLSRVARPLSPLLRLAARVRARRAG